MFVPVSSPRASLFPPCAFLCLFVCAMCPLVVVRVSTPHLFPISRVVCVIGLCHLCPVNSPCLVHLCPCLPRLDCSHLSLVICCLCVFLFLVAFLSFHVSCLFRRMTSGP